MGTGKCRCRPRSWRGRSSAWSFRRGNRPSKTQFGWRTFTLTGSARSLGLRSWATFLNADQSTLDAALVALGRKHALRSVSLTVFEDVDGPPSYKLGRDADVTVIAAVKQKTVARFTL